MALKRFLLLAIAGWLLIAVDWASATMIVQSYDQTKHDRFYVGSDKAFIGDPYDWSGVGRNDVLTKNAAGTVTHNGSWGAMISARYFLSANHYHPTVGQTLYFYPTNNPSDGYETAKVASGQRIAGSDLWLGRLDTVLGSQVERYPILSLPEPSDYDNLTLYTFGLSNKTTPVQTNVRLGRNQIDPDSCESRTADGTTGESYLFTDDRPGLGADESYLQLFDSGGPSLAIIDGAPAIAGIHWFNWTGKDEEGNSIRGSGDTFVPYYVDNLAAAMVGESPLIVVPEPSTAMLLIVAILVWPATKREWLSATRCRASTRFPRLVKLFSATRARRENAIGDHRRQPAISTLPVARNADNSGTYRSETPC
jgi:hypothetical protein